MKKFVLSVSMFMAACGVDSQQTSAESAAAPVVSTRSQAVCSCDKIPELPKTPAEAISFTSFLRLNGGRLIPATGLASAYTIAWQDPRDPAYFIALGFDVVNQKNLFYVRGSFRGDYANFTAIVANETNPDTSSNPTSWIDSGTQGQVHTGPPPLPPTGIPGAAWNAVYANYSATH